MKRKCEPRVKMFKLNDCWLEVTRASTKLPRANLCNDEFGAINIHVVSGRLIKYYQCHKTIKGGENRTIIDTES